MIRSVCLGYQYSKFHLVVIVPIPLFTSTDGEISVIEGLYYLKKLNLVFWGKYNSSLLPRKIFSTYRMYMCIYFQKKSWKRGAAVQILSIFIMVQQLGNIHLQMWVFKSKCPSESGCLECKTYSSSSVIPLNTW